MKQLNFNYPQNWLEYELIDSGDGLKLERFGSIGKPYITIRPDPRIIWDKTNPSLWESPDAEFLRTSSTDGQWKIYNSPPNPWKINYKNLVFNLRTSSFKHTGIFPEQATNWDFIESMTSGKNPTSLNLFAYTGGSTMALANNCKSTVHLDSSKSTISWAKENIIASGLENKEVRFIEDDAQKFVERELRRGNSYDCIVLDPPRFGRGPNGQIWKLEDNLKIFISNTTKLLSKTPLFMLLNLYTADLSQIAVSNMLEDIFRDYSVSLSVFELCLCQTAGKRLLPQGICARINFL